MIDQLKIQNACKVSILFAVITLVLLLIPTGFEKQIYVNAENCHAEVLEVNNSQIVNIGLFRQGEQVLTLLIKSGSHKGETTVGTNLINGKMESDKIFEKGEEALILLERNPEGGIIGTVVVDHYRIPHGLFLVGFFVLGLILFSGWQGVKTVMSFVMALLLIWKVLVPMVLLGCHPLIVALVVGNIITNLTVLLLVGWNKTAWAVILSTTISSLVTGLFAIVFGKVMHCDGTTLAKAEALLYTGFENLDLQSLMQGAIYLSCSGAILDLCVDVVMALQEIQKNQPEVTRKALWRSGLTFGRTVVGSQTTTLLLAYMGTYLSVLMVYMAQGTPLLNILSTKAIGSELLYTFVGCIGILLAAPLSAIIGTIIFGPKRTDEKVPAV